MSARAAAPHPLLAGLAALVLLAGCTTGPSWQTGTTYDHRGRRTSAESEATITVDGSEFTLTTPWLPGTTISGELTTDGEGWTAWVDRVEVVANWHNGWTWALLDASGAFAIVPQGGGGAVLPAGAAATGDGPAPAGEAGAALPAVTVELRDRIELWTLVAGEIRYYDEYIRRDEGRSRVQARLDRSAAYADWLRETGAVDTPVGDARRGGAYGPGVADAMRDALADADGALPEWMAPLLESGTVRRDLTEAAGLIQLHLNLGYLEQHVLDGALTWESG